MKNTLLFLSLIVFTLSVFAGSMELTSARLYRKQGEFIKSLQFYEDEIKKEPGDLDAHFERSELLGVIAMDTTRRDLALQIATDKINPARELLEKMVAGFREAQKPRTSEDEGKAKKLKKKIDEISLRYWNEFYFAAVHEDSAFVKASESGVKDPDPKNLLKSAIKKLNIAIMLLPDKWNAYGLKAQMLNKLDQLETSTDAWTEALRCIEASDMAKKDAENFQKSVGVIRENLLQNYYTMKRFDKTIEKADEILAKDPKDFFAVQLKAFALAEMTNDTTFNAAKRDSLKLKAVKALNDARTTRPNDATIVYYIAQFNLQLGDTTSAIASFHEYLKLDEKDATVLFNLGVLYLEGGSFVNTEKARDTFKKLTEFHPDNAPGWINYGVALIRLGKNTEGKTAVEKGKALSGK